MNPATYVERRIPWHCRDEEVDKEGRTIYQFHELNSSFFEQEQVVKQEEQKSGKHKTTMNPSNFVTPRVPWQAQKEEVERGGGTFVQFHQSNSSFFDQRDQQRPKLVKQKSTPIKFELKRSDSESQLRESELAAEQRDYSMYVRIVNGMSASITKSPKKPAMDSSLANVIRTRHAYSNSSDSDLTLKDDYNGVATPILSNDHSSSQREPLFAPRLNHQEVQSHLISSRQAYDYTSDERLDDDIFDLDL